MSEASCAAGLGGPSGPCPKGTRAVSLARGELVTRLSARVLSILRPMAEPVETSGREWLAAFAAELGSAGPTESDIENLLELAGVAAHDSERIAAPIACWLIGRDGITPAEALSRAQAFVQQRSQ